MDILQAFRKVTESIKAWVISNLENKVDKIDGKVLSSNDYTNEDVEKLNAIGDLSTLNTTEKSTLVGSVNELELKNVNMSNSIAQKTQVQIITWKEDD